jgi:hypothetical protein
MPPSSSDLGLPTSGELGEVLSSGILRQGREVCVASDPSTADRYIADLMRGLDQPFPVVRCQVRIQHRPPQRRPAAPRSVEMRRRRRSRGCSRARRSRRSRRATGARAGPSDDAAGDGAEPSPGFDEPLSSLLAEPRRARATELAATCHAGAGRVARPRRWFSLPALRYPA